MVDGADGFIVVTPEYNYGMPATLKNALDYLSREWAWKPIGFVSYGNTSAGTRSVQHAKQVVTTLRLVPLGATVAIRIGETTENGRIRPGAPLVSAALGVLDELVRLAHALRPMRERARPGLPPGPLPGSYAAIDPRGCRRGHRSAALLLGGRGPRQRHVGHPRLARVTGAGTRLAGDLAHHGSVAGRPAPGHGAGPPRRNRLARGRLGVVPDLRGQGLGRWLLHTAEAAIEPDCRRIVLFTGTNSRYNIGFYQSEGYQYASLAGADRTARLAKDLIP